MRLSKRAIPLLAGLVLTASAAFGQTATPAAAAKLEFDVATIRPSAPLDVQKLQAEMAAGKMPRFGPHVDAARADYSFMSLKDLMVVAYGVKAYQITGPDWMATEHFDISARMPEGATKDDAPKMLRALLEDRFQLKVHRDTQEHPVYALVVAKGGPRLKESPTVPVPIDPDTPLAKGEMQMDSQDGPVRITTHSDGSSTINMGAKGIVTQKMDAVNQMLHMESSMTTMDGFADMLTQVMQLGGTSGKQVVDKTELKGNYQIALDISLAEIMAIARTQAATMGVDMPQSSSARGGAAAAAPADASDPGGGSTVFKSVEALGLKLEPRKLPVEQLVVDNALKTPTEN